MGPLVPDFIGNQLNLIVGMLLGIAFGFVLEQAGFSSSRKLTGLFYGSDFTVLRVFFTAGVTAMSGVLILSQLGLLDLDVIYVNPTFLYPAIVGAPDHGRGIHPGRLLPGNQHLRGRRGLGPTGCCSSWAAYWGSSPSASPIRWCTSSTRPATWAT